MLHIFDFLKGLLSGLRDSAIPVQTAAASSLRVFIAAGGAQDMLRPIIPDLIKEYFRILTESESSSVVDSLQSIVQQFGDDIIPLAPAMTVRLTEFFQQFSAAANGDEEDDDAIWFTSSILGTIESVMEACEERPDVLSQLETILLPLIQSIVSSESQGLEYLDQMLSMIQWFTYHIDQISPGMFSVCGPLLLAMNDFAYDYLPDMCGPMLNFISKQPQMFLAGSYQSKSYLVSLLENIEKAFQNDETEYQVEAKAAATMLTSLLSSTRGLISSTLPAVYQLIVAKLAKVANPVSSESQALKGSKTLIHRLLDSLLALIFNDTSLALRLFAVKTLALCALKYCSRALVFVPMLSLYAILYLSHLSPVTCHLSPFSLFDGHTCRFPCGNV